MRGLIHVRAILESIGVLVLPDQKAIANAYQAFDNTGNLKDEKQRTEIYSLGRRCCIIQVLLDKDFRRSLPLKILEKGSFPIFDELKPLI